MIKKETVKVVIEIIKMISLQIEKGIIKKRKF